MEKELRAIKQICAELLKRGKKDESKDKDNRNKVSGDISIYVS